MDVSAGVRLVLKALKAGEKEAGPDDLEVAVIRPGGFKRLGPGDLKN